MVDDETHVLFYCLEPLGILARNRVLLDAAVAALPEALREWYAGADGPSRAGFLLDYESVAETLPPHDDQCLNDLARAVMHFFARCALCLHWSLQSKYRSAVQRRRIELKRERVRVQNLLRQAIGAPADDDVMDEDEDEDMGDAPAVEPNDDRDEDDMGMGVLQVFEEAEAGPILYELEQLLQLGIQGE